MKHPIVEFVDRTGEAIENLWGSEGQPKYAFDTKVHLYAPLCAQAAYFLELAGESQASLEVEKRVLEHCPDYGVPLQEGNPFRFGYKLWIKMYLAETYRLRGIEELPETVLYSEIHLDSGSTWSIEFRSTLDLLERRREDSRATFEEFIRSLFEGICEIESKLIRETLNKLSEAKTAEEVRRVYTDLYGFFSRKGKKNYGRYFVARGTEELISLWKGLENRPQEDFFYNLVQEGAGNYPLVPRREDHYLEMFPAFLKGELPTPPEALSRGNLMDALDSCIRVFAYSDNHEWTVEDCLIWTSRFNVRRLRVSYSPIFYNLYDQALSKLVRA